MTSGSLRLRVDHYALLRNMMLKVKGVPALCTFPMMYYPLSKDNRSTGFLMPSYGASSYKGHTISNAFFWAINRSQDATFLHDWYSKTGQSIAGEYRYVSLGGTGNLRTNFLNEHPITYALDGERDRAAGAADVRRIRQSEPVARRIVVCAGARRLLVGPHGRSALQHRHRPCVAADPNRSAAPSSGTTKGIRVTGIFDRQEYFAENATSSVRGNSPRIEHRAARSADRPAADLCVDDL